MDYFQKTGITRTPIYKILSGGEENNIFVKREDLIPFSFGGNKARKAIEFLKDIKAKGCDAVVTYGSSSSNHCRVIANMAASENLRCFIISPKEDYHETLNSKLINIFGADVFKTRLEDVAETINKKMNELSLICKPYFIQGGGHGNLGTKAYVNAYDEIVSYEKDNKIKFDYIFHASGTGTTQAGLVSGAIKNNDTWRKVVGISIARQYPRGAEVVAQSINEYINDGHDYSKHVIFSDKYICGGYGKYNEDILKTVLKVLKIDGIPLNTTYTGKAFYGMSEYLKENNIKDKNVLFINTGGAPLFFDDLKEL